jgi:hypothetical protein
LNSGVERGVHGERGRRILLGGRGVFHLRFNKCLIGQHRRCGFFAARGREGGAGARPQFLRFF